MGEENGGLWMEEGDQTFDLWPMHTDFWNMADGEQFGPTVVTIMLIFQC